MATYMSLVSHHALSNQLHNTWTWTLSKKGCYTILNHLARHMTRKRGNSTAIRHESHVKYKTTEPHTANSHNSHNSKPLQPLHH
jgi:hypothetical protein